MKPWACLRCVQPLRCLCGSKACRGYIGGVAPESALPPAEVEEMDDASRDPEPIMVLEGEEDRMVAAILDANVGLRDDKCSREVQKKW